MVTKEIICLFSNKINLSVVNRIQNDFRETIKNWNGNFQITKWEILLRNNESLMDPKRIQFLMLLRIPNGNLDWLFGKLFVSHWLINHNYGFLEIILNLNQFLDQENCSINCYFYAQTLTAKILY